jgi:hypothetical protein
MLIVTAFQLCYMPLGRTKKNQEELELNGTHQVLAYADDNLLGSRWKTEN